MENVTKITETIRLFLISVMIMLVFSCETWENPNTSADETGYEKNIHPNQAKEIEYEFDESSSLNNRVHILNRTINPVIESLDAEKGSPLHATNNSGNYQIIAQVDNPSHGGYELSATSITYSDLWEKVYVVYHANGDPLVGAIECYDVSDLSNPSLVSIYKSSNLEYNDVHLAKGSASSRHKNLYTAGNTDYDNNSYYSIFHRFELSDDGNLLFGEDYMTSKYLEYGTASAVMKYNEYVFLASSGTDGKLYPMRKGFEGGYGSWQWTSPGVNLKYMDNYKGKMVVLANGLVTLLDVKTDVSTFASSAFWSESFSTFSPDNGKNVVQIDDENIYFTAGTSGVYHYTYDDSSVTLQNTITSNSYENLATGLDIDDYYVYVTNGWGLTVFKQSQPSTLYHYSDFGEGSVNYVKAFDDLLFVAAGTSGLYILDKGNTQNSGNSSNVVPMDCFEVYDGVDHWNKYTFVVCKSLTGGSSKMHLDNVVVNPSSETDTTYRYVFTKNQLSTSTQIWFGHPTSTSETYTWNGSIYQED